jgi:hypothetical protein
MKKLKRILLAVLALVIAACIWLPAMHLFFKPKMSDYYVESGISPKARKLAARHIELWTNPKLAEEEIAKMRSSNAEWDFMGRTFLALALGNMAIADGNCADKHLEVMDKIIDNTIKCEEEFGIYHFLMPYSKDKPFVCKPARSIFLDGEIGLMIAARQMVKPRAEYGPILKELVDTMIGNMEKSPVLSGESYPDECWTFCNSVALATITISDVLDGRDHSEFCRRWIETAKRSLTDSDTGILVSSYNLSGYANDGPEGSTIWMVSHCLLLVDEEYAKEQYARAKKELAGQILGFGYAKEWPASWKGPLDIDAGPVLPVLHISPSSSGLAFIAVRAFHDDEYLAKLLTTLNLGALPREDKETLTYSSCSQVAEAVVLYSMTFGPLWEKTKQLKTQKKWGQAGEKRGQAPRPEAGLGASPSFFSGASPHFLMQKVVGIEK